MLFLIATLLLATPTLSMRTDCSRIQYERCVRMADPLVKQVHLIFPDNLNDIEAVCATWNDFVDCLKDYTENCFTEQQRRQFNRAVENPIESVHQMCTHDAYQKEYLRYAPCMKSTVTDRNRCLTYYNLLVDQVEQGDVVSKASLCCSHDRFKQCVVRETMRSCDGGVANGPASRFSAQIVDKALNFLQEQCYNYIPNAGDCLNPITDSDLLISTSEVYPWDSLQESKEAPARSISPPPPSQGPKNQPIDPSTLATQTLGARTRPASYGRSGSWADPLEKSVPKVVNAVESTAPSSSYWPTTTWRVITSTSVDENHSELVTVKSTTETWYPAAGSQLSNEVDEPNQQGLIKQDSGGTIPHSNIMIFFVIPLVMSML